VARGDSKNMGQTMSNPASFSFGEISDHQEAVSKQNRFEPRLVGGEEWTFDHLEAFVIKMPIVLPPQISATLDVVVLFSNHCFTRALRSMETLADDLRFDDERETRVLDEERYTLSKQHLLNIVKNLPSRKILIADASRPNYVTVEIPSAQGQEVLQYAVFFEVEKDKKRNKRVLLRIQSAYLLEHNTRRLQNARKINFSVLLKNAYCRS
jgi:hypothetical protein